MDQIKLSPETQAKLDQTYHVFGVRHTLFSLVTLGVIPAELAAKHTAQEIAQALASAEVRDRDYRKALSRANSIVVTVCHEEVPIGLSIGSSQVLVDAEDIEQAEARIEAAWTDNERKLGYVIPLLKVVDGKARVHAIYVAVPIQYLDADGVHAVMPMLLPLPIAPNEAYGQSFEVSNALGSFPTADDVRSKAFTLDKLIEWPQGKLTARIAKRVMYYKHGAEYCIPTGQESDGNSADS